MPQTPYDDDALRMSSDTELEEVIIFIKRRLQNPFIINGKVVWNFSNHKVDREALEFCTEHKLEKDRYVIPFQVTGTWGFMIEMLPQEMRQYEVLVYKPQYEDYAAYRNLLAEMDDEDLDSFRDDLQNDLNRIA